MEALTSHPRDSGLGSAPIVIGALLAWLASAPLLPAGAPPAAADDDEDASPPAGAVVDPWRMPIEIEPPRLERRMPALYPDEARDAGLSGVVLVRARIGRDGRVRETAIEQSVPGLDDAAMASVRRDEFTPARRAGLETECWVLVPVRFDLSMPTGGRAVEPLPIESGDEAVREFESAGDAVRDSAAAGDPTLARNERAMRASLALDVIPAPEPEAVRDLMLGDSLARAAGAGPRSAARAAWARAIRSAPWWPEPYGRIAAAAIADRDYQGAARAVDVWLAGRPGDPTAIALRRRAGQLRQAQAIQERGRH